MTDNPQTRALPTRVAAVLFDMDGTLVDSEGAWFAAADKLWAEVGASSEGKVVVGGTIQDVVDAYVGDFPDTDPDELAARVVDLLAEGLEDGVETLPGAADLLARLSARLPVTIASNSPSRVVQDMVSAMGWDDVFTVALGTEDVERPKPAPDLYLTAAARCGADPAHCVVFEDSVMGATAGRAAGAFVVTIGESAAHVGDLNVADLTDPRIVEWNPEAIA